MRSLGWVVLAASLFGALAAPMLAPYPIERRFPRLLNAPPTMVRVHGDDGRWHWPFIYKWTLTNQLEQQYEEDRSARVPLVWLAGGRLVSSADPAGAPLLLLGADSYGRDVLSRLLFGARTSLALSLTAALGAVLVGSLAGGIAGYAGGTIDELLMRGSDFIVVLPTMYVALALRAALPLVLSAGELFLLLVAIFAAVGAPFVARGVRAIVRGERELEYAVAAVSLGAGCARLLFAHLLPAARGFIVVQITMLVPAFIVAEATLSYVGLGFPDSVASWGSMLHDASTIRAFADFPWLLSPAVAMFLVVFGLNLSVQQSRLEPIFGRVEGGALK